MTLTFSLLDNLFCLPLQHVIIFISTIISTFSLAYLVLSLSLSFNCFLNLWIQPPSLLSYFLFIYLLKKRKKGDSCVQPLSHVPRFSWVSPRVSPARKWSSETLTPHKPHWFLIHTLKLCNPHNAGMGCQTWAPFGDTATTYHFGTQAGGPSLLSW